MVDPDLKLIKKVTSNIEGAGRSLPRSAVERIKRLSQEDSTCCLLTLRLMVTQEVVRVVKRWHRTEERQNPHNNKCRERIITIIERTLTGKARMNAYKDKVAETEEVKEVNKSSSEAGDVPGEAGNEAQMTDRHAVASCEEERQHDENRMRDIQIGKRGSETACQEQPGKLRKTTRFEQETPITSSSSSTHFVSGISCEW